MEDYLYQSLSLSCTDSDSIEVPFPSGVSFDSGGAFTLEAWIKVPVYQTNKIVITQKNGFTFELKHNQISFSSPGKGEVTTSTAELFENTWHSLVVIAFQKDVRIFIDGRLSIETLLPSGYSNTSPLIIAKNYFGNIRWIRIYKKALMATDLGQLIYSADKTTDMAAFYDFTQNPPLEKVTGQAIAMGGNLQIVKSAPAAKFHKQAYFIGQEGNRVNPGGHGSMPYTVQMWFCPDAPSDNTYYTLFSNVGTESTGGIELTLQKDGTNYKLAVIHKDFASGNITLISRTGFTPNTWVNVAAAFESGVLTLYVNGNKDIAVSNVTSSDRLLRGNRILIGAHISHRDGRGHDFYSGLISRIDVWSTALTIEGVKRYITADPEYTSEHLLASWNFFEENPVNLVSSLPLLNAGKAEVSEYSIPVKSSCREYHRPLYENRDELEPLSDKELEMCRKQSGFLKQNSNEANTLTSIYEKNGELHIVMHTAQCSFSITSLAGSNDDWDELTLWKIQLFLIILNAIGVYIFTKNIPYTRNLGQLVYTRLVQDGEMTVMLGNLGTEGTAACILGIIGAMLSGGVLKELLKMALPLSFWSILTAVAIMGARVIGGGTDFWVMLGMLAAAVVIHLRKLARILCTIQVHEIYFIHNQPHCIGGINIRKNKFEPWFVPEWSARNNPSLPDSTAPVVYRISRFQGDPLKIKVNFTRSNVAKFAFVKIRGTAVGPDAAYLGSAPEQEVTFPTGRCQSRDVYFTLSNTVIQAGGIQKKQISWQWEYYDSDKSTWVNSTLTNHTVYTVLGDVHEPWSRNLTLNPPVTQPWTEVYDLTIDAVRGVKKQDAAAKALTGFVYNNLNLLYGGGAMFAELTVIDDKGLRVVNLQRFLDGYHNGQQQHVNCEDCSVLVIALSNIYGCQLIQLGIAAASPGFKVNRLKLIGESDYRLPIAGTEGYFEYHAVATDTNPVGDLTKLKIYDACMKYHSVINGAELLADGTMFSKYNGTPAVPIPTILLDTYRENVLENSAEGIGKAGVTVLGNIYMG